MWENTCSRSHSSGPAAAAWPWSWSSGWELPGQLGQFVLGKQAAIAHGLDRPRIEQQDEAVVRAGVEGVGAYRAACVGKKLIDDCHGPEGCRLPLVALLPLVLQPDRATSLIDQEDVVASAWRPVGH